eukprot:5444907-Lingulodinium_polyedra.AAC.1
MSWMLKVIFLATVGIGHDPMNSSELGLKRRPLVAKAWPSSHHMHASASVLYPYSHKLSAHRKHATHEPSRRMPRPLLRQLACRGPTMLSIRLTNCSMLSTPPCLKHRLNAKAVETDSKRATH